MGHINVARLLQFVWYAVMSFCAICGTLVALKICFLYKEGLNKAQQQYSDNILAMQKDCPTMESDRMKIECMTAKIDVGISPWWTAFDYLYKALMNQGLLQLHIAARSVTQISIGCAVLAAIIVYFFRSSTGGQCSGQLPTAMFYPAPVLPPHERVPVSPEELRKTLREIEQYKPRPVAGFADDRENVTGKKYV